MKRETSALPIKKFFGAKKWYTLKINIQSENVMKKIGMVKIMQFDHPNIIEGSPLRKLVLYAID